MNEFTPGPDYPRSPCDNCKIKSKESCLPCLAWREWFAKRWKAAKAFADILRGAEQPTENESKEQKANE